MQQRGVNNHHVTGVNLPENLKQNAHRMKIPKRFKKGFKKDAVVSNIATNFSKAVSGIP